MPHDLGFGVPLSRRNLSGLRDTLRSVEPGCVATATFRTTEHGQFTVTGPVRRDLTGTILKIGWWDVTNGKKVDPVAELQCLTSVTEDADVRSDHDEPQDDELQDAVATLREGDVVAALFSFEGCGAFTVVGGIKRDTQGSTWVVAGHHLTLGDAPAPRLRRLTVEHRAPAAGTEVGAASLFD